MDIKQIILAQYYAALAMFEEVIVSCPDSVWDAPGDKDKTWSVAYHTLFFVHLYAQPTEADFVHWEKHREDDDPNAFTKDEIMEYLALVKEELKRCTAEVDLHAESGFHWLKFSKLELQFYNIRHIQQHTGELFDKVGTRADITLHWVGTRPTQ